MYEIRVTGHKYEHIIEHSKKVIPIIKLFRIVTGVHLKDAKDIVYAMLGIEYDYSDKPFPHGKRRKENAERKPYTLVRDTLVRAEQVRIEFRLGGFTAEVHKVNG